MRLTLRRTSTAIPGSRPTATSASDTVTRDTETADLHAAVATIDADSETALGDQPGSEKTGRRGRADRGVADAPRSRPFARTAPTSDAVARVNLLSPWVLEELAVHSLRRRFGYAVLALVVAIALAWGALTMRLDGARTALAGEEAAGAGLSAQIADLAPVRGYVGAVDARANSIATVMEGEVSFARMLVGLQAAIPPNATLESLAVTLPPSAALGTAVADATATDPAASSCPGPDPFAARPVVGCLQITGTANTREAVSTLVLRLGRNPLFAEPFITTTTAGETDGGGSVTFSGSVGVTERVGNLRYADLVERLGSTRAAAAARAAREAQESDASTGTADAAGARTGSEDAPSTSAPSATTEEQP